MFNANQIQLHTFYSRTPSQPIYIYYTILCFRKCSADFWFVLSPSSISTSSSLSLSFVRRSNVTSTEAKLKTLYSRPARRSLLPRCRHCSAPYNRVIVRLHIGRSYVQLHPNSDLQLCVSEPSVLRGRKLLCCLLDYCSPHFASAAD